MTRRRVAGLAADIQPLIPAERPPGPPTILGPDGRTWTRATEGEWAGLYLDETGREVYSQAALRDLIDRATERLAREVAKPNADPVLVAISLAEHPDRLRELWQLNQDVWTDQHTVHARGRRAVLELAPKERT